MYKIVFFGCTNLFKLYHIYY